MSVEGNSELMSEDTFSPFSQPKRDPGKLREWITFGVLVVGIIASAGITYQKQCARADAQDAKVAVVEERMDAKIYEIERLGTVTSRTNAANIADLKNSMVKLETNLDWTRVMVSGIDSKLDRALTRLQVERGRE